MYISCLNKDNMCSQSVQAQYIYLEYYMCPFQIHYDKFLHFKWLYVEIYKNKLVRNTWESWKNSQEYLPNILPVLKIEETAAFLI